MLACDLILVLTRAFQVAVSKYVGQLLERDVETAAMAYRAHYKAVHDQVRRLVPRGNCGPISKPKRLPRASKELLDKYRKEINVGEPASFFSVSSPPYQSSAGLPMSKSWDDALNEEKEIMMSKKALESRD